MPTSDDAYRYERKFVTEGFSLAEIEGMLRLHPAHFQEIYPPRYINNIYLDTPLWRNYHDSVEGFSQRRKVRVRWYGSLNSYLTEPKLEIKNKQGGVGNKQIFPLPGFKFNISNASDTLLANLRQADLSEQIRILLYGMRPVLVNRYCRAYRLSKDARFRITIDSHLTFYSPHHNLQRTPHKDHLRYIIELKYENTSDNDRLATEISRHFPFRLSKSSKYIYGVDLLHGLLS